MHPLLLLKAGETRLDADNCYDYIPDIEETCANVLEKRKKITPDESAVNSRRETYASKRFSIPALKPKAEPSKLLDHEMKVT